MALTDGHDPGAASQERSRRDQDRPGAVSLLGQGEDSFTVTAWSSPGDKTQPHSRRWAQWWHPWSRAVPAAAWHGPEYIAPADPARSCQAPQQWMTLSRLTSASWSPALGMRCQHFLIPVPLSQFFLNTVWSGFCSPLYQNCSCEQVSVHLYIAIYWSGLRPRVT